MKIITEGYPKTGIFHITTDEYKLPDGWVQKEKETTIIGETEDLYVERVLKSSYGLWERGVVRTKNHKVNIGFHKSRLVRWKSGQLSLF